MERAITCVSMVPAVQVDQYQALKVDGSIVGAASDFIYGICRTGNEAANESIEVVREGQCYAIAGEAISAGDILVGGADGKLMVGDNDPMVVVCDGSSTYTFQRDRSRVVALEDAAADGDILTVLIY